MTNLPGPTADRLRELADEWADGIQEDGSTYDGRVASAIQVCRGAAARIEELERRLRQEAGRESDVDAM